MKLNRIAALTVFLFTLVSCFKDPDFNPGFPGEDSGGRAVPERSFTEPTRRVMIMVSAGFNSLSSYLSQDLADMEEGYLPDGTAFNADVVLVLSRLPKSAGNYTTQCPPVLYRLYKNRAGEVQKDTLRVWADNSPLCQKETLQDALTYIRQTFPAKGYGMVFSSHSSGWLPAGYTPPPVSPFLLANRSARGFRTIGQDKVGNFNSVEMDLRDFADAIPMKLDYLLLDACLNGCVEVAWALRDKADVVGFSPTEVLSNGYDYLNMTRHLLSPVPDPVAVCRDFFEYYDAQSGSKRSATITVVAPRQMDALAGVCRTLFEKYRTAIGTLDGNRVQGYFRFEEHRFFYDLKDILIQAGITQDEEAQLDQALEECILYKAATPYFFEGREGAFPINCYSGFSMYLPSEGTDFLDDFYRDQIDWNHATHLVE